MSDDELLKLLESEEALAKLIAILPEGQRDHLQAMADEVKSAVRREDSQGNFLAFVKAMWPNFIFGRHHAVMCRKFEEIASGEVEKADHQHAAAAYEIGVCFLSVTGLVPREVPG